MEKYIRSFIFDILFYSTTLIVMVIFLPLMLLPRKAIFWVGNVWARVVMALLKKIVGLSYVAKGVEHLPTGPFIVACKHESAWETIIFHELLNQPGYALKKELGWIPIFNLYLWRMGMVFINRGAGASALKSLIKGARRISEQNRPLIIYPEGTRGLPGKPGNYQAGVGVLYRELGIPVVPVALNSGLYWGKRSPVKLPGQITLEFLPPIQPGLSRADFMEKLANAIDKTSMKLARNPGVNDV